MDIRVSLDGAAAMLLLSLPWLLLALAAWRAARPGGRGTRRNASDHGGLFEGAVPQQAGAVSVMAASPPDMSSSGAVGCDLSVSRSRAELRPDDPVFTPVVDESPSRSADDEEKELVLSLATAKAERDDASLSRSSVLLARLLIARSERVQAATLLQSAAMVARRAKLPVTHAEARIELAELALVDGDMTSACEHWQMAKLMFHETGRRLDQDRMADIMRQHRCPTDWVLTNF